MIPISLTSIFYFLIWIMWIID